MASHRQTISLHDPHHNLAIQIITAATAVEAQAISGDPQPAVRTLALVLSHRLDADRGLATNKAIRERGEEVGKDFAGLARWMRGSREQPDEPMLHAIVREMAGRRPNARAADLDRFGYGIV